MARLHSVYLLLNAAVVIGLFAVCFVYFFLCRQQLAVRLFYGRVHQPVGRCSYCTVVTIYLRNGPYSYTVQYINKKRFWTLRTLLETLLKHKYVIRWGLQEKWEKRKILIRNMKIFFISLQKRCSGTFLWEYLWIWPWNWSSSHNKLVSQEMNS